MSGTQDKTISFGIKGDAKGLDPINKAIKNLSSELEKLNKLVKQINFSGSNSNPNSGFLNKVVKEEQAMRKLFKTTSDTAQAIDRVFNRSMEQQSKQVENLTKKLELLNAQQEKRRKYAESVTARGGSVSERYRGRMDAADREIADTESQRRALANGMKGGGGGLLGMLGKGALVALVAEVSKSIRAVGQAYANSLMAPTQNQAIASRFNGNLMRQAFNGDLSSFFEMVRPGQAKETGEVLDSNLSKINSANNNRTNNFANFWNGSFGGLPIIGPILGGKGLGGVAAADQGLTQAGRDAYASQRNLEMLQAQIAADPVNQLALEDFSQNAATRLNNFRMYGGEAAYNDNMRIGRKNQMVNESEIAQLQAQLSDAMGSTRGNQLFGAAAGATANYGLSKQSAVGILSGLTTGAGGDTAIAEKRFEDIMAKAFNAGIRDSKLKEDIAKAVAESQIGIGGRAGGVGMADVILNALKGLSDTQKDKAAIDIAKNTAQQVNNYMSNLSGGEGAISRIALNETEKKFGVQLGSWERDTVASEGIDTISNPTDYDRRIINDDFHGNVDRYKSFRRSYVQDKLTRTLKYSNIGVIRKLLRKRGLAGFTRSNTRPEDQKAITEAIPIIAKEMNIDNSPEAVFDAMGMFANAGNSSNIVGDISGGSGKVDLGAGTTAQKAVDAEANARDQMFSKETFGRVEQFIRMAADTSSKWAESASKLNSEEIRDASKNVELVAKAIKTLDEASQEFLKNNYVLEKVKVQ